MTITCFFTIKQKSNKSHNRITFFKISKEKASFDNICRHGNGHYSHYFLVMTIVAVCHIAAY